jgi:hypothetical protein
VPIDRSIIFSFPVKKSRFGLLWSIEQIIPKIDPGEIGSAFHRAGADIVKKNHLWMDTNYFSPINF